MIEYGDMLPNPDRKSAPLGPLSFEEQFEKEILKSEQRRVSIIALLFGLAAAYFIGMYLVCPQFLVRIFGTEEIYLFLIAVPALVCLYGLGMRARIAQYIRGNRRIPHGVRFVNALVETSIPSVILLVAVRYLGPVDAFAAPTPFLYFIFIILSTLRLDFRLSLFTGVVAAAEYALLFSYFIWWPGLADGARILTSPMPNLAKCLLFILAGGTAGIVTSEIKNRVQASLSTLEKHREILNLFGQHVSPEVVNRLLDQTTDFEGEVRHVAVMFLDIRGFTTFAEGRQPSEVVAYLNQLFEFMVDIINENGGILNKFLGDGFLAVFGAPISDGRDSRNAVTAALAISMRVDEDVATGTIPPTKIGIGIHSGEVMTGTVGSNLRKEYTIIGDVVNLASRIEQLNKEFGSSILISGDTWVDLRNTGDKEHRGEHVGEVHVKGREQPVDVYRLG